MKWYYRACALVTSLPLIGLGIGLIALWILDCNGNFGPAGNRCVHASKDVADALTGLMYVGAFGWLLTVPLGGAAALVGYVFQRLRKNTR
ncbi:MAG: hypothetical protein REI94_20700 [Moraxellaceae bacterium]|nr:hypothetical protein [Moraxellaceae bacterium]